jgi:hypothetical protein
MVDFDPGHLDAVRYATGNVRKLLAEGSGRAARRGGPRMNATASATRALGRGDQEKRGKFSRGVGDAGALSRASAKTQIAPDNRADRHQKVAAQNGNCSEAVLFTSELTARLGPGPNLGCPV